MRRHPFATVVASIDDGAEIAHLPLLVDRKDQGFVIHGHAARGNRLCRARMATAVFHGPHAYISARWYGAANMVPTWHYLTVHAHGSLALIDDPTVQRALVERLGATFEGEQARLWWQALSTQTYERFRNAISWFRMDVLRVEGKAKLGQDDSVSGRLGVIESLRATGKADELLIAEAMAATLPPKGA